MCDCKVKDKIVEEIKKVSKEIISVAIKPANKGTEIRKNFCEICFLAGRLAVILSKLEGINEKEENK